MVDLVVVGAGIRGTAYARHAIRGGARIVAICEPDPVRRTRAATEFDVSPERVYGSWEALRHQGKLADGAIVATQDRMHADPAVLLAGQGYHLLLEKPMAATEDESARIADAVVEAGVFAAVCHVLRYTAYTTALKTLLPRIGRLVSVQHLEPVGWWHYAHAFVRGPWHSEAESSPMLLAKSCHDIDWLLYLTGQPVHSVSSFGGLAHFRPDQRPAGAADRCLDCPLEPTCPYSAPRLYLGCLGDPGAEFWPLSMVTPDAGREAVLESLRTGPYGRCVYSGTNDVVDHQVVSMELADGATVSFTMTAFTPFEQRKTRLFGTHGYLEGDGDTIRLVDFLTGEEELITVGTGVGSDHSDGDEALVTAFLDALRTGDASALRSDVLSSLAGHRVVWAAERARRTRSVVVMP